MEIRKAFASDALNIAAIGMCVWIDTYATEGVYDKISRFVFSEFTVEKILEIIKNKTVLVSINNSRLSGYIVLGPEKGNKIEIETLYVLPRYQLTGIGKKLIERSLKSQAKVYWLSAWELNRKAIKFYSKLGFQEKGELYFDLYGDKIRNIVFEIRT